MPESAIKSWVASANSEPSTKVERSIIPFNKKSRTWRLKYICWTTSDYKPTVEFEFEKSLYGLSMALVHKDLHDGMNIGVYAVDERDDGKVSRGQLLTVLRVDIPNLWPERDPHQAISVNEMYELYEILIRETHSMWFQRLADGWRNYAFTKSGARDFDVNFVDEEEAKQ